MRFFALRVHVLAMVMVGMTVPRAAAGQVPAAVASERIDVNGDGALDVIRIEDPPALSVILTGTRSSPWKPFATSGRKLVGGEITTGSGASFGNQTVIVAVARFANPGTVRDRRTPTIDEAMVVAWRRGALVPVWSGIIGSQGRDGDYAIRVEATRHGVLRYQIRPDVARCDGKPAYLYPERFDFRSGRFRTVYNAPRIPGNAPVLTATATAPDGDTGAPAAVFRTRSASTQVGAENAGQLATPRELDDGDPHTAWREGLGGDGRGEFITLATPLAAQVIRAIRITPGDAASPAAFGAANRLKRVGVLIDDTRAYQVELATDPLRDNRPGQPYWVILPDDIRGRCVTLVIDEVYRGGAARSARAGDTVIADVAVLTDVDLAPGGPEAALVARVIQGGSAGRSAARLLAARGTRATQAVLAAAARADLSDDGRLRLRRVLARIGDPAGAAELVRGLAAAELSEGDRAGFTASLTRMGEAAVTAIASLVADPDGDASARQRGVAVLVHIPTPAAQAALIAAAGSGDRAVRKAVSVSLGQRDVRELAALIEAARRAREAGQAGKEADLIRAAGLMARRGSDADRAALAEIVAERLTEQAGYELLYRLTDAAAATGEADLLDAIVHTLARAADVRPAERAHMIALRRVLASSLADSGRAHARQLLVGLAGDPDPGVRRHALSSLGQRSDATEDTDRAIIARLQADRWPQLRRIAASALARRCGRDGPAARELGVAVDGDADVEVRRAALTSLVECRAPGISDRLIAVARDGKQPGPVRERALGLIPVLGDRALAAPLVALFSALQDRAWSSKDAIRLAAACAVAMGRLGDQSAVRPLLRAAREDSFPEIQAAAVAGLGEMCPRAAAPVFDRLIGSSEHGVALAARNAREQCRARRR